MAASDLTIRERIGVGSFGTVYKASSQRDGTVAVKMIDLDMSDEELEDVRREIEVLASSVTCEYLVRYLGCYVVESQVWIVTEYLEASLSELIGDGLPEATVAGVVSQVLKGLVFLHQSRRVHRDVKSKNILVSSDGSIKLADFGVAAQLSDTTTKKMSMCGSPYWMAPEVITSSRYDAKADVWSLGITAIELADSAPPHSALHPMKVLFVVPGAPPPVLAAGGSDDFKRFLARCLSKEQEERPTASQLETDPFVLQADLEAAKNHLRSKLNPPPPPPREEEEGSVARPPSHQISPPTPSSEKLTVARAPTEKHKSRAFKVLFAPAIAAAARHAIATGGGESRRAAAASLDELCKALENVDRALPDGRLTLQFALGLADTLEKNKSSLDNARRSMQDRKARPTSLMRRQLSASDSSKTLPNLDASPK